MDAGERGAVGDVRLLAVAFTAGVLLLHAQATLPSPGLLVLLSATVLLPWRGRVYLGAFVLGFLLSSWHAQTQLATRWPEARFNEEIELRGAIASLPEHSLVRGEQDQAEHVWRFTFAPQQAGLPPRIRVSWYRGPPQLRAGSCWQLRLRLRAPHGSLNPGGFDYEAWLYRQHLGATATVRDAQSCGEASGYALLKLRQAWVDRVVAQLGSRPGAALLEALTVGATGELRDDDWDALRLTGTTHLIAISGFNLAVVAGFAWWLLRWLWPLLPRLGPLLPAQTVAGIGALLVAAPYAALAGFEAPVARALFMLTVVLLALSLDRPAQPSRVLAIAWLAVLAPDPCAVLMPGLWLSFAAVAAILFLSMARWRPERPWRAMLRLQLFLSLALAPLSLYYFHGLSGSAPWLNLLAVPAFALLTPLLLLGMLAAMTSASLASLLLPGLAWVLEQMLAVLQLLAQWSAPLWWPAAPPTAALLLAALAALLLFAPSGLPLRPLGVLCLLPLLWPPQPAARGGLELTVLDVGQGLAVLVRTARHALLFDAGPAHDEGFDAGAAVVAPYVLKLGLRELDLLLLSHGDNDHAGGVPAVRRLLRVRQEIGTEQAPACRDGQAWNWDGVRFRILHPADADGSRNDASCVLKIEGSFTALLPGDIEKAAEARLLSAHGGELRSELLLAPHHGSRSSSTPGFVAAVSPQWVVFPAGWRNRFRHPRPEVVRRYGDCGQHAQLLMSGEVGAITLYRDSAGVLQAESWRPQARHFWNAAPETAPYWRVEAACDDQSLVGFGASPYTSLGSKVFSASS